jgi:hypothetical protein
MVVYIVAVLAQPLIHSGQVLQRLCNRLDLVFDPAKSMVDGFWGHGCTLMLI